MEEPKTGEFKEFGSDILETLILFGFEDTDEEKKRETETPERNENEKDE